VCTVTFGHCEVPERRSVILHSYSTQNQQRPYQKLSEKWLLITSLSGCSLEQKLPSSVTHSPDWTRPGTPFLTSAIPGLRSTLECRNLISSNSFAHRLGTGNSALRLAPGPVGLKPELRQGRSEFIYKMGLTLSSTSQEPIFRQNPWPRVLPYTWSPPNFHNAQLLQEIKTWQVFTCSKAPDQEDIAEIGETPLAPALQSLISVMHYPSALANSTLIILI
jgi:hypothetical protein